MCLLHLRQRQSNRPHRFAHQIHGRFHGDRVHLGKQRLDQRNGPKLQIAALCHISLQIFRHNVMGVGGRHVGKHGDDADTAQGQKRNNLIVISGIHIDVSVAQIHHLRHMADIAGSLFHAHNILHIVHQMRDGFRSHAHTGTAGNVIHDRRNLHFAGNLGKVRDKTVLCSFIIVGSHQKNSIRSCLISFF